MFRLTEEDCKTAIHALRLAADDCAKSAREEFATQPTTSAAFDQLRDRFLSLADKIENRDADTD